MDWLRRFEPRRIDAPRRPTRLGAHYDPDAFGRLSEGIARFFGTARYLVVQTILVILWIGINVLAVRLQWDAYPFILLNLAFSTQAAYAAPLILLAQTRQAERDQAHAEWAAKHTEAIAEQHQELLQQNTKLTEEIHRLTADLHAKLVPAS